VSPPHWTLCHHIRKPYCFTLSRFDQPLHSGRIKSEAFLRLVQDVRTISHGSEADKLEGFSAEFQHFERLAEE
jgi:hypothetical protein